MFGMLFITGIGLYLLIKGVIEIDVINIMLGIIVLAAELNRFYCLVTGKTSLFQLTKK